MSNSVKLIKGLGKIAGRYEVFILDLWGVVHNGRTIYPGAGECMLRLRATGKQVALLSNAPRPAWAVAEQIAGYGVEAHFYDLLITSGDATVTALNNRSDDWHAALGRRYYHIGPEERSAPLLEAVRDKRVDFAKADYLLISGLVDDNNETVEDYREMLQEALARKLPMICANPDLTVMRGEKIVPCAGKLARYYEEMGGVSRSYGKPNASAFAMVRARLDDPPLATMIMVGDSFRTDVAGAENAAIDSLWLAGGLHAEAIGYGAGETLSQAQLTKALANASHRPTLAAGGLVW